MDKINDHLNLETIGINSALLEMYSLSLGGDIVLNLNKCCK